jgi:hypothetical protein
MELPTLQFEPRPANSPHTKERGHLDGGGVSSGSTCAGPAGTVFWLLLDRNGSWLPLDGQPPGGFSTEKPLGRHAFGMHQLLVRFTASTLRAPASSASSCFRRAVRSASPWGRLSCGRCVSLSSVPACLQSWWYLPLITSFVAISSGFPTNRPANRMGMLYMLTGISPEAKAERACRPRIEALPSPHLLPAYNDSRHEQGIKKPARLRPFHRSRRVLHHTPQSTAPS